MYRLLSIYLSGNLFYFLETRYKHEVLVDGEPILFEILDTCPKVISFYKKISDIY